MALMNIIAPHILLMDLIVQPKLPLIAGLAVTVDKRGPWQEDF